MNHLPKSRFIVSAYRASGEVAAEKLASTMREVRAARAWYLQIGYPAVGHRPFTSADKADWIREG